MARTSNLIQRKGWYFNRAYPKDLWQIVGKAPFRLSLGTDSLEEAQRQRGTAEQRYWAAVDEARRKLGDSHPRALSENEAVAIVSRWFRQRNQELHDSHLHRPSPPEIRQEVSDELDFSIAHAAHRLGTGDIDAIAPLAGRVLEGEGIKVDPSSRGYKSMLQLLWRANKELSALDRARFNGDFGYRPSDPIMLQALEAPLVATHSLDDLIREYETAKKQKGRWTRATIDAHAPVFCVLRETLGGTRDLRTIGREEGRQLFNVIVGLPVNRTKIKVLAGLSAPQAVEKARALGLLSIAAKTINSIYVPFSRAMFQWAVDEGWMDRNPLEGDYRVEDRVADNERRDEFLPDQLKTLFHGAPWDGSLDRDGPKAGKFWIPLLCLFHGLRLGEAAGMHVADVTEHESRPVFHLRAFEGRSSKTLSSRGLLPIHPELISMGFLAYVEQRRRAKAELLFPDVRTNANGKVGAKTGEWFAALVKGHGLKGRKLTMHSFRHNFESRLREQEVPERTALALARRTERGSRGVYGDGLSVRKRAETLATIYYPGLDLSHLHVTDQVAE